MKEEELELLLREWGALSKYNEERSEGAGDFHALERAKKFAPKTRERAARQLVGRDGGERRRYMARELRKCGVIAVPMSFVDPVPCTPTRRGGGLSAARARDSRPPRLRAVDDAALALYRVDVLRGLVLRQEYCGYGAQTEKAERVGIAVGSKIGLRIYRESLALARGWMLGRLSDER